MASEMLPMHGERSNALDGVDGSSPMSTKTRKILIKHPDLWPGTWWPTGGKRYPTVCCPECQTPKVLTDEFSVDKFGRVSPDFTCSNEDCRWSRPIQLRDWKWGKQ